MEKHSEKIAVIGYSKVSTSVAGLCVRLSVHDGDDLTELTMYPEESRKLRKALKRAEKAQAAA